MKYYASIIAKGESVIKEVPFEAIDVGDIFFVGGYPWVCGTEAHYSGDASYDGYLLYDTDDDGWFPEDLDDDVELSPEDIQDIVEVFRQS